MTQPYSCQPHQCLKRRVQPLLSPCKTSEIVFQAAQCNMLAEGQQNNVCFVLKSSIPTNSSHPSPVFGYFVSILSAISGLRVNIAPTDRNVKKRRKSRGSPIAEGTANRLTTATGQHAFQELVLEHEQSHSVYASFAVWCEFQNPDIQKRYSEQ